jgi:hypothetical protein
MSHHHQSTGSWSCPFIHTYVTSSYVTSSYVTSSYVTSSSEYRQLVLPLPVCVALLRVEKKFAGVSAGHTLYGKSLLYAIEAAL